MPTEPTLRVLSLGAGVQSSVMALMAAHGELPRINCAIFADTQWEPKAIYEHLDWLETVVSNPLRVDNPFPIYRVSNGNIREDFLVELSGKKKKGKRGAGMPLFPEDGGIGRRQCTSTYKIEPVRKKIRALLDVAKGDRVPKGVWVELQMGITTDEAMRMKPSRDKWVTHTWPLIEKEMSRQGCLNWFKKNYPDRTLEKSACIGCPYHNNTMWRDMKINDPVSFADAVDFDKAARKDGAILPGMRSQLFLHRSCKPLDEVDFRNLEDKGQLNMFNNECEGMCGV